MAKSKNNRHSLNMPVQGRARQALKETETQTQTEQIDPEPNYLEAREQPSIEQGMTQSPLPIDAEVSQGRPQTPPSPNSPELLAQAFNNASPQATPPRHGSRDTAKSFFSNFKAAQSGTTLVEPSIRRVPQDSSVSEERKPSRTKSTPDLRAESVNEPVPDLPPIDAGGQYAQNSRDPYRIPRRPLNSPPGITVPRSSANQTYGPGSPAIDQNDTRRNGRRFFGMRRTTPGRNDEGPYSKPSTPTLAKTPDHPYGKPPSRDHSTGRNPSPLVEVDDALGPPPGLLKDQRSQSFRDGPGSVLFQGLSKGAGKAAAGFSKTKKWLGSAATHNHKPVSSSTLGRQEPIPNYQVNNLTLPLQQQTRITRIAKRLEDSKDKTEFWMPALPWRCIDYLNFTGCESEGLYRIPGSDREIKLWWQRFDQEHDINLFEQEGLYDVNVIGSLFKMWLRNLPEPILDEATQDDLIARHEDQKHAPEELKEILSRLPPWNYYLLFAITCHLSLLNAYEEKNKMSLQNLFICVGPGLRMKQKCFSWLVGDWRSCWTGCLTEKEALEDEYRILSGDHLPTTGYVDDGKSSFSSAASNDGHGSVDAAVAKAPVQEVPNRAQQAAIRRKENRPARLSPAHSRDDSHLSPHQEGSQMKSVASPTHGRNNSHIPELNLPGKMSPLFAPDGAAERDVQE